MGSEQTYPLVAVGKWGRALHVETDDGRVLCDAEWTDAGRPPDAVILQLRGKPFRHVGNGTPTCKSCADALERR